MPVYGNFEVVNYRFFILLIFIAIYILKLYFSIFIIGFELDLDFLNYYEFYSSSTFQFDRWGIEVVTPVLFEFGKILGLDFYSFCFLIGILWLIPIILLSRYVRVEYLCFYCLFFLVWFSPQFIFLFRQYVGIFFAILFFVSLRRGWIYLLLCFLASVLAHLSIIIIYLFSFVKLKSKRQYVLFSIFVLVVYSSYFYGFSLLKYFEGVSLFLGIGVIDRKLSTIGELAVEYASGSTLVYGLLCCSMVIHSFKVFDSNRYCFSIERAFFFSAAAALFLSEFIIFSNRVGALAYFFSVPYFLIVISKYRLKI